MKTPVEWEGLSFFKENLADIEKKLVGKKWFPGEDFVFSALEGIKPQDVKVIIIGQDPYPTPGHANGLAFSVNPGISLPRSLANIYKELRNDVGGEPKNGDLSFWKEQGVLLLNTSLSVEPGKPASHSSFGWDKLIPQAVREAQKHGPVAFILWGRHAENAASHLVREGDFVIKSAHPSPFSADRGFFGSRPFSKVNDWLSSRGKKPIKWF